MVWLKAPSRPRIVACARFKSSRSGGWGRRARRGEKKVVFFLSCAPCRVAAVASLDSRWAMAPGGRRGGVAWRGADGCLCLGGGRQWQRTAPDLAHVLCLAPDATGESIEHSFRERSLRPEAPNPKSRAEPPRERKLGAARRCGILEKVILVVFPPPMRAGAACEHGTRHHVAVLLSAWERVALPTFFVGRKMVSFSSLWKRKERGRGSTVE